MRHILNKEEAGKLLVTSPEDWPVVQHVLDCPECLDLTLAELVTKANKGELPPAPRRGSRPRGEAWTLMKELLQAPYPQQSVATIDPRFHRADVVDLLLSQGEKALGGPTPAKAVNVARLAQWLAAATKPGEADSRARLVRAYCLEANGCRLTGAFSTAERALDDAALFLPGGSKERGPYCQALALLRWEQGKVDEAAALLRHGAKAYGEAGRRTEEGISLAQLGFLYMELGEIEKAPGPLVRGMLWAGEAASAALRVKGGLSFALCLAALGKVDKARHLLEQTWLQYPHLLPVDKVEAQWLEGRVAARLGAFAEAEKLLDSARRSLLTGHRPAEAALASLDLSALFLELDRAAEADFLVKEFELTAVGQTGADLGLAALRDFAEGGLTRDSAREGAALLASWLRQRLRVRYPGALPLPRF